MVGTNDDGPVSSGIPLDVSDHRDDAHFRHNLAGRRHINSGPAPNGIDVPRRACFQVGWTVHPWPLAGFVIQVGIGLLLFSSEATKMYDNLRFQVKVLILIAGINALVSHSVAYQSVGKWTGIR